MNMKYKNTILSIQRGIISGLAMETFELCEINKRVEIINKILLEYKGFFKKEQILILKWIFHDWKK